MILELSVLFLVIGVLVWVVYSIIIGGNMGAPYVVTPDNILGKILAEANLEPGNNFWDLGCGNGKVIKYAMKKYKVNGFGVEINPILVLICRIRGICTYWGDFLKMDLKNADVVYMYLGPGIVEQIAEKMEKENVKPVRVILRRFEIKRWKKYLVNKIPDGKGWVYYYKITPPLFPSRVNSFHLTPNPSP
jgi:hypothetical protein